jgi:hypothetical protein
METCRVPAYPERLHHKTPAWVPENVIFHIRIRVAPANTVPLTTPLLAASLLTAAERYHNLGHWWCELFLLMPDHVHALLRFPAETHLAEAIRQWKRGTTRFQHVNWQVNFFDHRLRNAKEANEKWRYIRLNPVVKGLCAAETHWPYVWSPVERVDPNALPWAPAGAP